MTILEMKDYCKSYRITYAKLSEASGVSKGVISNIFAGYVQSPRIDTINKIEYGLRLLCGFEIVDQLTLTKNERNMISMYRLLPPTTQKNLYELIEVLSGEKSNKNSKPKL